MSIQALSLSTTHTFSKHSCNSLTLLPDLGVEGDCHCGETVQHRSRLHIKPPPKNLRQVHLMDVEILDGLGIKPGELGENVTTRGVNLLGLGAKTKLHFLPTACQEGAMQIHPSDHDGGSIPRNANTPDADTASSQHREGKNHPILVVTGLRNPCPQISHFQSGLQESFVVRDDERKIIGRKAGVMSTVEVGGIIEIGMRIVVEDPLVYQALECV